MYNAFVFVEKDMAFAQRAANRTEQQVARGQRQVAQWVWHVVWKGVATGGEQASMPVLSPQPVSIAIEADQSSVLLYKTGVLTAKCGTKLAHDVVTLGEQGYTLPTLCPKRLMW